MGTIAMVTVFNIHFHVYELVYSAVWLWLVRFGDIAFSGVLRRLFAIELRCYGPFGVGVGGL